MIYDNDKGKIILSDGKNKVKGVGATEEMKNEKNIFLFVCLKIIK